jgi:hypothetical protein
MQATEVIITDALFAESSVIRVRQLSDMSPYTVTKCLVIPVV